MGSPCCTLAAPPTPTGTVPAGGLHSAEWDSVEGRPPACSQRFPTRPATRALHLHTCPGSPLDPDLGWAQRPGHRTCHHGTRSFLVGEMGARGRGREGPVSLAQPGSPSRRAPPVHHLQPPASELVGATMLEAGSAASYCRKAQGKTACGTGPVPPTWPHPEAPGASRPPACGSHVIRGSPKAPAWGGVLE